MVRLGRFTASWAGTMTVFEVVVVVASARRHPRGWSIPRYRSCRGDLRRAERGRERGPVDDRGASVAPRVGGSDQWDSSSRRACGWDTSGPPGVDAGAHDRGGRIAYRPCRTYTGTGANATRVAVSGDGTLDVGDVHVRSYPPARRGDRRGDPSGVAPRCRSDDGRLVIDVDSTICEVAGKQKQKPARSCDASAPVSTSVRSPCCSTLPATRPCGRLRRAAVPTRARRVRPAHPPGFRRGTLPTNAELGADVGPLTRATLGGPGGLLALQTLGGRDVSVLPPGYL